MITPHPQPLDPGLETQLNGLLCAQGLAVLSTQGGGQPYSSLVAFASTPGLDCLLFATTRGTRKFSNLSGEPRVSLLIDSRSNQESDFHEAVAATAVGRAEEVSVTDRAALAPIYLAKHPYLEDFLGGADCALIRVRVDNYWVVQQFQEVRVLSPRSR